MSRSMTQQRQQQKLQLQQQQLLAQQQPQIAENESAAAGAELFDLFCVATTMRQILGLHRNMCDLIGLHPAPLNDFYPKLKAKIRSWRAQALWKKFDARALQRVYLKGTACTGTRVLVIGAGPCGLRTAIEAQLLGAKVVVLEKRDRISRNNVLHLWPFVITDLRNLGAKKFYGKFCAGSIDHISIRQLQCILLKVALLLGVEIHEGVSFEHTIEPGNDGSGWRAAIFPKDHVVSHYEFDVLIGADGKRNTLEGFKRKEFRGKLAIAITANFINKKTEAEAKAEEISGVAFIFNQSFFKELYHTTGIDLENIVYYKDETHYFVMTAKKHSLIDKGVILQDFADPAELLAQTNVNTEKLLDYAREAAEFSTKYQMPNLEFAVNHYGKPDVAMFDFTSMFAAESSCRVVVRNNFRLLQCLVGDSLLEPFWPTGSGCARGFLSSMDAAYAIKLWSNASNSVLGVIAQRESIYRLLNQTTPENLQRDIGSYTVDPATRYPNLNRSSVNVWQVKHLIDTDDKQVLEQIFMDTTNVISFSQVDTPSRRKRRSGDITSLSSVLLRWICAQLHVYEFTKDLKNVSDVFSNGLVLCALINRYRPDLVDMNTVKDLEPAESNDLAFHILEKEMHVPRIMSGNESQNLDSIDTKIWLNYLEQICEVFRGEIPHIKHPKIDFTELREKYRINYNPNVQADFSKLLQLSNKQKMKSIMQELSDGHKMGQLGLSQQRRSGTDEDKLKRRRNEQPLLVPSSNSGENIQGVNHSDFSIPRRARKRRGIEKNTTNHEEQQRRLKEIEENRLDRLSKRRQQRYQQTQNFYKSLHMLQANTLLRESGGENTPFEDYSIFLYRQQAPEFNDRVKELERKLLFPDRERNDIPSNLTRNVDEHFNDRIKSMEQRISSKITGALDKKPKDLMRAIGKIDSSDWNVREIEKKIEQSKRTEVHGPKGREKVPKWSKEQFRARQNKLAKPNRQDSTEVKYKDIDQTLRNLDKQLKEGSVLEVGQRGRNKVASIAGQFVQLEDTSQKKKTTSVMDKTNSKVGLAFKKQSASELCHFCHQTVYLMEKLQTEGLIMHRTCLKCHHCHSNLRLGAYAFDRDDPNGHFYCTQHFKLPAKVVRPVKTNNKHSKNLCGDVSKNVSCKISSEDGRTVIKEDGGIVCKELKKGFLDNVVHTEFLDRGQTPERIEFENTDTVSVGEPSKEHIIDEHEWSGRNFLPDSNDATESDLSTSDDSEVNSDSDIYEEAIDSPLEAQTLQLATDWIDKQNYSDSELSDEFYDSSEEILDDGKDDTEGEEFQKAREMRREEVRLQPLPSNLPTDTETEVQTETEESSSSNNVERNSATEISTDSEFDHDELINTTPKIFIDDTHLRKATKVQIKSNIINTLDNRINLKEQQIIYDVIKSPRKNLTHHYQQPITPQFKPLIQVDPMVLNSNRAPLQNPRFGDYILNKTASTEGIASRKSLELKKRYLLGEPCNGNKIQKSGSTSVLDSRIRTFQSNISECQKLLNPGNEISASMKTFLNRSKFGEKPDQKTSDNITANILNDLRVEITIQKGSSTNSTDNEKENKFVSNHNQLNKDNDLPLNVVDLNNDALQQQQSSSKNKTTPSTPTNVNIGLRILECIDLITPEKDDYPCENGNEIIDLTGISPDESNLQQISKNVPYDRKTQNITCNKLNFSDNQLNKTTTSIPRDSDIGCENTTTPDISKDARQSIPDILDHIENQNDASTSSKMIIASHDENENNEKSNYPERTKNENIVNTEMCDVQIEVPLIPWNTIKSTRISSTSGSGEASFCSSSSSSNVGDIEHYILESTTSPESQNFSGDPPINNHQVPRLEVHDSYGTLMQIDSLMIIDGKYIGDPEDLKYMEIPDGLIISEATSLNSTIKTPLQEHEKYSQRANLPVVPSEQYSLLHNDLLLNKACCTKNNKKEIYDKNDLFKLESTNDTNTTTIKHSKFDTKNESKIETLKNLPLIVEKSSEYSNAVKPNISNIQNISSQSNTISYIVDNSNSTTVANDADKTPTAAPIYKESDSETEPTCTGQILTENELSDWNADDCISENFIDLEFAINDNHASIETQIPEVSKLFDSAEILKEVEKTAPIAEEYQKNFESIDFQNMEFMDTASDCSLIDSHSPTKSALKNDNDFLIGNEKNISKSPENMILTSKNQEYNSLNNFELKQQLNDDKQVNSKYIIKTVPNKTIVMDESKDPKDLFHLGWSPNENPSLNHILNVSNTEEENTMSLENNSNSRLQFYNVLTDIKTTTTETTTTEESEALTIVTSPMESSSPKKQIDLLTETTESSTQSNSEQVPKTSLSTLTCSRSSSTKSNIAPNCYPLELQNSGRSSCDNDISYEDYCRILQLKIAQISTAFNDSCDSRKQRRKNNRTDTNTSLNMELLNPANDITTDESIQLKRCESSREAASSVRSDDIAVMTDKSTTIYEEDKPQSTNLTIAEEKQQQHHIINKVPEIQTLTRKLEEITRERRKQKDLIHDLVMDKLQSKKQLNAEKRLNRFKQRTVFTSLLSNNYLSSVSHHNPQSTQLFISNTTTRNNPICTSQAHYHMSTAVDKSIFLPEQQTQSSLQCASSSLQSNLPEVYSSTYQPNVISNTRMNVTGAKPRMICSFKENMDILKKPNDNSYKKTDTSLISSTSANQSIYNSSKSPLRHNRGRQYEACINSNDRNILKNHLAIENKSCNQTVDDFCSSIDNLRFEARERARLKSNSELGLSPEEKMHLLRLRLKKDSMHLIFDHKNISKTANKQHDEHKNLNTSKSANDLRKCLSMESSSDIPPKQVDNFGKKKIDVRSNTSTLYAKPDFTSDPNLLLSLTSETTSKVKPIKHKSNYLCKDTERRKSLIRSLSSFFSKNSSSGSSPDKNKGEKKENNNQSKIGFSKSSSNASTSHTISSGLDGMLSRLRIVPRSKIKCTDTSKVPTHLKSSNKRLNVTSMESIQNSPKPIKQQTSPISTSVFCKSSSHSVSNNLPQPVLRYSSPMQSSNYEIQPNQSHQKQQTNDHNFSIYEKKTPQLYHQYHLSEPQNRLTPETELLPYGKCFQQRSASSSAILANETTSSRVPSHISKSHSMMITHSFGKHTEECSLLPAIPPLPINYQKSDDDIFSITSREQKRQRAISKAVRQAELKRLRIAQEIQREQEEIDLQLKELEGYGVNIEKTLRGENQSFHKDEDIPFQIGNSDEKLLKELLEIWHKITELKKRDEELGIRQQELQLEHRHAQLKEELNMRLSSNKLEKNFADIAAEGAILNEMLDIVAKRAALRPSASFAELTIGGKQLRSYNAMNKITSSTSLNEISSIHCNPSSSSPLGYEESNV